MPRCFPSPRAALRNALLAAVLLAAAGAFAQDHAYAWNPRSGDAWIDAQLADINAYGARYRGAFVDELARYHAAPRALVEELVDQRNWAPGDVYYACALAQVVGRPCRAVADAWGQSHDQGWAAVAGQLGVAERPDAVQRLRQDIIDSYARWGRPLAKVEKPAAAAKEAKPARPKKKEKPRG
ncbi:MAG TPA: hypothetical protein VM619_08245 [Luteimonas sp.]|nr:hypothetical protein [Luteimonas sp.]